MRIIMYSTGCPKSKVLASKLDNAVVEYEIETDMQTMCDLGFTSMPMLSVDGEIMDFKQAIDWIKTR